MPKNQSVSKYQYIDQKGSFRVSNPDLWGPLYFPLANEAGLLSSITPQLKGDIKIDQHSFLTIPISREDLHLSRSSRNFWVVMDGGAARALKMPLIPWSVAGQSAWQRAGTYGPEKTNMEAGFLWHTVTRTNSRLGIEAQVTNFIPSGPETMEVMRVRIKNISSKKMNFTPLAAIPLFGRSADNLRDHRHVTSLLNRVSHEKYGLVLSPTMSFDEKGHRINHHYYFVLGVGPGGRSPEGFYPTISSFSGEAGDLEKPEALLKKTPPVKNVNGTHQGKEVLGGLCFSKVSLGPGKTAEYILLMGIDRKKKSPHNSLVEIYNQPAKIENALTQTQAHWEGLTSRIRFTTGDEEFNQWVRWVCQQPTFRKIFGCSFLPDFDYGRGGRGWRDLWQDCLALILFDPESIREDLLKNFGGVRVDGSNATIIARKAVPGPGGSAKWTPEFIADRNNIVRVWMDHGIWPFLTTRLYLDQTGDWKFLLEEAPYFRDARLNRGKIKDDKWGNKIWDSSPDHPENFQLKTESGEVYKGTVLEHILVQTLVPFFNVGPHNNIKLENADWNDGLDLAPDHGESVAFTAQYAGNLRSLAEVLNILKEKGGIKEIRVFEELSALLDTLNSPIEYEKFEEKGRRLSEYFEKAPGFISGRQTSISISDLQKDLFRKSQWLADHLNGQEWLKQGSFGWYNGYYDNKKNRVEGIDPQGRYKMTLTGQVFQILGGVAETERIKSIIQAVKKFLWDKKLGGIRLNTNFGTIQPDLGRCFSFSYGEKENGAVFSHMVVMYAAGLYKNGFFEEGHQVLQSLYKMAKNSERSRIYPGLPEYFNNEGRGLYHYLTGSASWYVLVLLTQVFGVRGRQGDLMLAPQLVQSQFDKKGEASVKTYFGGTRLKVIYHMDKRSSFESLRIKSVSDQNGSIPVSHLSPKEVVIQRELVVQKKTWTIHVHLGT